MTRIIGGAYLLCAAVLCGVLFAIAFGGNTSAQGATIAQGFKTSETNLSPGALVSLVKNQPNTIELADTSRAASLAGIVSTDPLITLSDGGSTVQVVTQGVTSALVSDVNGSVKTGDRVTVSPIAGVGMKVTGSAVAVGIAQADFDSSTATTRTITNTDGSSQQVHIGLVPVQVGVAAYISSQQQHSGVPSFLQNAADSVAGRSVSVVRVLFATLLIVLLFVTDTVLLYAAVRSSIISIGRNPLSEAVVRKSLLQVGLTVAGVTLIGVMAVFAVLKI